jgi:hypothetical protein
VHLNPWCIAETFSLCVYSRNLTIFIIEWFIDVFLLLHFNHVQIKCHCGCHDLTSLKHVTKNSNLIKIRYLLFLIVVFCVWLFGNTQTTNNISYEVMSGNLSLLTTNNISYEVMSGNLSTWLKCNKRNTSMNHSMINIVKFLE